MTTTGKSTSTRKTPAKKAAPRKTTARSTKTTAAKTTPKAAPKAAPAKKAAPKVAPVVVEAAQPVLTGPMMRKKELIDAVVAQSGVKKRDAKPVIEAMLSILGEALRDGRELNLQPMGKVMVRRSKKLQNGTVLTAKVRVKDAEPEGTPSPVVTKEAAE